jgi:molecular chaperone HtpG
MSQTERHEFQAEVKQLLDLMIHSLYSERDIFLRELISNASDAIDKLRFEMLTRPELGTAEPKITLAVDKDARTLTISDTGIGMSRDEVVRNIGTIARSGTKEFLGALKSKQDTAAAAPTLIGQFGVGFYSAFMVADRIELVTRRAGETAATRWESVGDGAYTLAETDRAEPGTTIVLHLKPTDADDEGASDYTDDAVLGSIVKRYSDFVAYPIVIGDRTLNSMKAIWDRPKSEVTEEEYKQFYRHISHDWNDPLRTIATRIEGTFEASALLYIPEKAPHDLYAAEMKRGLQLYVKRVFVMDECKDLMPAYLRFVRGIVDAHDLSLNVSREILQKDRQIALIKKQLTKKVLATLDEVKRDDRTKYESFWKELGPVLKEGLAAYDAPDKDKLLDLVITRTTHSPSEHVSLGDYVARMKEGQDAIYYLVGAPDTVAHSPLLEAFAEKGYEVLLFSDAIDELWLERAPRFGEKPMKAIDRGAIDLGSKETADADKQRFADLLAALRVALQEDVKEVRLSTRLASSAACLVGDENDLSPRMARMLEQMGQTAPKVKRILEVNPQHPLLGKLLGVYTESKADPRIEACAKVLYGQAQLAESGTVADPQGFNRALGDLALRAL